MLRIESCEHHETSHTCEDSNIFIPLVNYMTGVEDFHLPIELLKENEDLKKFYFQVKHKI